MCEAHAGRKDRETWRIRSADGSERVVVTSKTSVAAMDDAVEKYAGALKRLAKR